MHSQTKVGRKRSIAVLLAAVVAMVSIIAGTAPAGAVTPLPAKNPTCLPAVATGVGSATVKWTKPVPADDIFGYLITINPGPGTTFEQTPPPFAVAGVDTLTAVIPNLLPGKQYSFTVQSTNADGNVNGALAACTTNLITALDTPVAVYSPYVFGLNRDTIIRHFQEFLQRDPNFSELSFWDRYFFNSRTLISSCRQGGYGYNTPIQYAIDTAATSKIGPFCPNSGPEIDLINFLIFGEDDGVSPFDTGGDYNDYDKKTYAGVAEPITRLYLAYFGRVPEFSGLKFWYKKYKAGRSLTGISDFFAQSTEFDRQYGDLNDSDFVTLVYINVLARNEDFGGQNFWRGQLEGGLSRGDLMTKFSESNEYKRITNYAIKTITIQAAMLGTTPTKPELDTFVNLLNNAWNVWCIDNGVANEIQTIRTEGADAFTTIRLRFTTNAVVAPPTPATDHSTANFFALSSAAQVQTALENLPNIGVGNVRVTAAGPGNYQVEFIGALAQKNVNLLETIFVSGNGSALPTKQTQLASTNSDGYQYIRFDSEKIQPDGRINLGGGTFVGAPVSGAGNCPQNGVGGYDGEPYYNLDTDLVGDGAYYASPIVSLIAVTRNSPAYKVAVAKPAGLI